jgi:hypothetical protein
MRFGFLLFLFTCFFVVAPHAVEATTLSPALLDISLQSGESAAYEITLYNESEESIVLDGSIEKFVPRGEYGEVDILPFDITDASINWIKLPTNSILLEPGATISVPVIVNIPTTADIGGYYLAVMWESSSGPLTAGNNTRIVSRVGTLLLLTVDGDVKNSLELTSFSLEDPKNFYDSLPIEFSTRLRNTGNIHQRPEGSVVIKNFLGGTTEVIKFNSASGSILPQTNRIFQTTWGVDSDSGLVNIILDQINNFNIGRFSAKIIVEYEEENRLISDEIYFWVFPWQVLLIIFVVVLLITLIVIKIKRGL